MAAGRKGIEEHTRRDYQASLEADAIPFFGRTRLTAITAQDVKRFAAHVAARGVSANTVRLAVAPVRCLLADALSRVSSVRTRRRGCGSRFRRQLAARPLARRRTTRAT
jgi:hypothetical protein